MLAPMIRIAHQAAGGTAGLYALHAGRDDPGQVAASWFAKPPGWSYGELLAALDGPLGAGIRALAAPAHARPGTGILPAYRHHASAAASHSASSRPLPGR